MKPINIIKKLNESYAIVEYYDDKGYPIEKIVNGSNPKNVETKVQRIADRYEVFEIRQASADVADSEYLNSLGKGVLIKDTFKSKFEEPTFESSQATLDTSRIADFIKRSVKNLTSTDYTNCRYNLDDTFALFVGWSDGYDENATDEEIFNPESPTWRINAGIKIRDDYDWADYDFLNFPWYENGEVFDCSLTIDKNEDYEHDARYFVAEYKKIKEEYEAGQLLTESDERIVPNNKELNQDIEDYYDTIEDPITQNAGDDEELAYNLKNKMEKKYFNGDVHKLDCYWNAYNNCRESSLNESDESSYKEKFIEYCKDKIDPKLGYNVYYGYIDPEDDDEDGYVEVTEYGVHYMENGEYIGFADTGNYDYTAFYLDKRAAKANSEDKPYTYNDRDEGPQWYSGGAGMSEAEYVANMSFDKISKQSYDFYIKNWNKDPNDNMDWWCREVNGENE